MRNINLSNTGAIAIVDDEDYPILSRLTWYISDSGYAVTDTPVKHLKMHKLIIGPIKSKTVIDHINRNKLDNRKSNLRVVSHSVNINNSDRIDNAKHYYFSTNKRKWIIDSPSLGVRCISVDTPGIANRVVKRLKLGFPVSVALKEAHNPTISISNWKTHDIRYDDYKKSMSIGLSIKDCRRTISRRGPAKPKTEAV